MKISGYLILYNIGMWLGNGTPSQCLLYAQTLADFN